MIRGCMICGANFEKEDSLKKLREHKEDCSKDSPLYNDESADSYDEWIRDY